MPLYEYRCGQCGEKVVRLQKAGEEGPGVPCARCGGAGFERVFSAFSLGRANPSAESSAGEGPRGASPPAAGPEFHRLMVTNNPELLK